MKRLIAAILCCMLLACPAVSLALTLTEPLAGVAYWPEDSTAETASYVYSYSYPRFENDSSVSEAINVHFQYLVDDALAFAVPMTGSALRPEDGSASSLIETEIKCHTDDYLSVLITSTHVTGDVTRVVYAAHTFTLTGALSGSATNLPRYLGLLPDDETDEWLLERQTEKADTLVRSIIWRKIQKMQGTIELYDDLTEEILEWSFYPEEDFYLNEDSEPVFFIQPGVIADEAYGMIEIPVTLREIDDEM